MFSMTFEKIQVRKEETFIDPIDNEPVRCPICKEKVDAFVEVGLFTSRKYSIANFEICEKCAKELGQKLVDISQK